MELFLKYPEREKQWRLIQMGDAVHLSTEIQ
jgi:hypothetical protein